MYRDYTVTIRFNSSLSPLEIESLIFKSEIPLEREGIETKTSISFYRGKVD